MADILENPVDLIDDAYEQEIQVEQEMIEVVAYRSYNRLDDKPQINGVELVGNKTSSDLGITAQIESAVNSEAQARAQADNTLQGKIDTEKLARQQADSTLQGNIDAEETARKAADKDIQDVLDGETLARQNADIALGGRIDTEIHDRQVADIGLQGQIDAITSKSDVVDVVATYADLQAYDTQHLGDNDVIKVLDDETHGDALTYYRWSKTNQTWTFIGQEAPYYSKSQTDTLLLGKQNTIDSSHKLSADLVDDTSTTNKFVKASDITNWNSKQDALTAGQNINITNDVISTPAIAPEVVSELPSTGTEGKLYLTPKAHTTQTATGNPITATVAEDAGKIESFQLDGDTEQATYEGKNLYNPAQAFAQGTDLQNIRLKVSIELGQTYTFNISDDRTYATARMLNSNDSQTRKIGDTLSSHVISFTPQDGEVAVFLDFYSGTTNVNVATYDFSGVQLELGSTATSYEPYCGGVPSPNPSYPQPIQTVTGEQTVSINGTDYPISLSTTRELDMSQATRLDAYINGSGVIVSSEGDALFSIPVEPNTAYTITKTASSRFRYVATSTTPTVGANVGTPTNTDSATSATITTGVSDTYLVCVYWSSNSTQTKDAIFNSVEITERKSIELCKLGTYQDYIYKDGDSWKVHKATASYQITGQESDLQINTSQTNTARFFSNTALSATGAAPGGNSALILCNRLERDTTIWSTDIVGIYVNQAAIVGRMNKTVIGTTVEEARNYFANNPTLICYQLATPTDTVITDTDLIAQLEAIRTASLENGTNTITNTATGTNLAGDMEIGYYGFNPTNRYDKWLWLDLNNNYEQIGGE